MEGKQGSSKGSDRPRLRRRRAVTLGALTLVGVIALGGGFAWLNWRTSLADCTALQQRAAREFAAKHYQAAYDRLAPHRVACIDWQGDPDKRTSYTATLATSAVASGHRDEAKRLAEAYRKWGNDRLAKDPNASAGNTADGLTIMDIYSGDYAPPNARLPRPDEAPVNPGGEDV